MLKIYVSSPKVQEIHVISHSQELSLTEGVADSDNLYLDSHIYLLLASFMLLWHKLKSAERKEKQLKKWRHKIDLIFLLINILYSQTQTIMDGDTPEPCGV